MREHGGSFHFPLAQVGTDTSTGLLRDLDLGCQECEGHRDQTHACKVKGKRFLRQSTCRMASAYFLKEKTEKRANVSGSVTEQNWGVGRE